MSDFGWLPLAGYVAGYAWCYRYVVGWFLDDMGRDDLFDIAFAFLMGALATLGWPLMVAARLFQRWYLAREDRSLSFFRAPRPIESRADRSARLNREATQRERYIARLESELGIGQRYRP